MRCNIGINPALLTDQHLRAEYRELPIVQGFLRRYKYRLKSIPPKIFTLGKGHILFFTDKMKYLHRRHELVRIEARKRGFSCNTLQIVLDEIPNHLQNDYTPTAQDAQLLMYRITQKLYLKPLWYRFNRKKISDMHKFVREFQINIQNPSIF